MKFLGIDYGLRRIGLAISDGVFASPLGQVDGVSPAARIASEQGVEKIIIGLPSRLDPRVKLFGDRLHELTHIPVEYWDETFSTREARKSMIASGTSPKKRRQEIDQNAAAVILQGYLDSQSGGTTL